MTYILVNAFKNNKINTTDVWIDVIIIFLSRRNFSFKYYNVRLYIKRNLPLHYYYERVHVGVKSTPNENAPCFNGCRRLRRFSIKSWFLNDSNHLPNNLWYFNAKTTRLNRATRFVRSIPTRRVVTEKQNKKIKGKPNFPTAASRRLVLLFLSRSRGSGSPARWRRNIFASRIKLKDLYDSMILFYRVWRRVINCNGFVRKRPA